MASTGFAPHGTPAQPISDETLLSTLTTFASNVQLLHQNQPTPLMIKNMADKLEYFRSKLNHYSDIVIPIKLDKEGKPTKRVNLQYVWVYFDQINKETMCNVVRTLDTGDYITNCFAATHQVLSQVDEFVLTMSSYLATHELEKLGLDRVQDIETLRSQYGNIDWIAFFLALSPAHQKILTAWWRQRS